MKHILKKGKISLLLPEGQGGGLSGEVHLVEHVDKKYVVRRCSDILIAKEYENISKRFAKYHFLPKFLGELEKMFYLSILKVET